MLGKPEFLTGLGNAASAISRVSDLVMSAPSTIKALQPIAEFGQGGPTSVAVTGLSRSGKSVFITSLAHNLMSVANKPARMPLLKAASSGRVVAATLHGPAAQTVPLFPYRANVAGMAANPPRWPEPTNDISEIEIDIRFKRTGVLSGLISRSAELRLNITDYPGEWLLDLPLLRMSYDEWSRATLELCSHGIRATEAGDWRNYIALSGSDAVADETTARQAHELYRTFLIRCRERYGLNYLQPGRFIRPGGLEDAPFLWFCPLEPVAGGKNPLATSLHALMQSRFESYKTNVVEPFYRDYFRHFSRQIVLVDVLQALLGGEDTFRDCQMALEAIMESFRFGSRNFLPALFGSRIERVLFAATKVDHVTRVQRDHLTQLLTNLVAIPESTVKGASAAADVMALASVVCTEDATEMIGAHTVDVVVGRPVGSDKRVKFFPGPIPTKPPKPGAWPDRFLDIPGFQPPSLEVAPTEGIPHINLDAALELLIGDKLA
jgi:hypothetical protein